MHYTNYFSCRKKSQFVRGIERYLSTIYHIIFFFISVFSGLRFISWSSPPFSLFNWPCAQLYLKFPNHIYILKWYNIHCLVYFAGPPTKGEPWGPCPDLAKDVYLEIRFCVIHQSFWFQHSQNLVGGPVLRKSTSKFLHALDIS